MGGITGVDAGAALALADALGFDRRAIAHLLPFIEAGIVEVFRGRNKDS